MRYLVSLPEVDLNHRDTINYTALHCAVEERHTDVVQVLIDAGADLFAGLRVCGFAGLRVCRLR